MPTLLNQTNRYLDENVRTILEMMFSEYQELIVKTEFTEGYSDSLVFLVRPCRFNSSELPAIVKVGPRTGVQQEWEAYQHCIQHRLPTVAGIQSPPIFESSMGGLRYQQIGEGTFEVESLARFCFQETIENIEYVLRQRLFTSLSKIWKDKRLQPDTLICAAYDSILPVNLIVDLSRTDTNVVPRELNATAPIAFSGNIGDLVHITGFQVTEIAYDQRKVLLNSPFLPFRFYIIEVPDIERHQIGDIISTPLRGEIIQTRETFLTSEARKIVASDINLQADKLRFFDETHLPNPLKALPAILSLSFDVFAACIHGDLHLSNVLVESVNRNAYLIDFAKARKDHVLRDFLHMEMSILTRLLPIIMAERNVPLVTIRSFYENLHKVTISTEPYFIPPGLEKPFAILQTLRREAQEYLYRPNQWQEYYAGLFIYLLSALKFDNLNAQPNAPLPKQLAFWGAAIIQDLMEHAPNSEKSSVIRQAPVEPTQERPQPLGQKQKRKKFPLATFVSIMVVIVFVSYFFLAPLILEPQNRIPTVKATDPDASTSISAVADGLMTPTKIPTLTPTPIPSSLDPVIIPVSTATSTPTVTYTPTPTFTSSATPTPTPSLEPQLVITYRSVNLRAGPGDVYDIIGYITEGTAVTIIEKSRGGSWYHVQLANGSRGWLAASVGQVTNESETIPTAALIPPTPTKMPTATPTAWPTSVAAPPVNPTGENAPPTSVATSVPTPEPPDP